MRRAQQGRASESTMRYETSPVSTSRAEVWLTRLMITITIAATIFFYVDSAGIIARAWHDGRTWMVAQYIGVLLAIIFPIYGNLIYQFSRFGHLKRLADHRPAATEQLEAFVYAGKVPALTILIPSYKEELRTVAQTVLSAALQEYPNRRVVLLID